MTAPNIHRINSDHFKPVPIGDQWNNCRKIVYKKAPNGIPMRATPAIVPSSVIIGDTEANTSATSTTAITNKTGQQRMTRATRNILKRTAAMETNTSPIF